MSVAFQLQTVSTFLTEPEPGDASLKHNETFEHWNHIYGDVVHTINRFIGLLNHVGANIDKVEPDDLDKALVTPLAGDFSLIKQNANACTILKTGMHAWAGNVDRIHHTTPSFWEGRAAEGFGLQMEAYSLAMDGIGEAMRLGTGIFNAMGDVSERLGVAVENAIVKGAQLIMKVAKKVLSKVDGLLGWLSLGYDIVTDGFKYFEDLISDIRHAMDLIHACFRLKDQVVTWVDSQVTRVQAFQKIPDVVDKLPTVTPHDVVTSSVSPVLLQELKDLKTALSTTSDAAAVAEIKKTIAEIKKITEAED